MDYSLFIGLPVYGGVTPATMGTIINIMSSKPGGKVGIIPDCALIAFARAELLGEFVHSDASHMLFLDADIAFDASLIERMVNTEEDIVVAAYPTRKPPHEIILNWNNNEPSFITKNGERAVKIHSTGLGCTIISKKAAIKAFEAYPELHYTSSRTNKTCCALFIESVAINPADGYVRYMGEDISFFERLLKIGFQPICLVDSMINHAGFAGKLSNQLKDKLEKDGI